MQQVYDINKLKTNITQIISQCDLIKNKFDFQLPNAKTNRSNSLHNQKLLLTHRLDINQCIKNIKNRAKSEQQMHKQKQKQRNKFLRRYQSMNQQTYKKIQEDQNRLQRRIGQNRKKLSKSVDLNINKSHLELKPKQFLPKIKSKYDRSFDPKNASSSIKIDFLQKSQSKKTPQKQQHLSFFQLNYRRRNKQQLARISIVGKILKENILRQKKILTEKKKQRRLDKLSSHQLVIRKSCLKSC